ncbi:hypothetical protein VTJ04DRAFT_2252 [Mycothermus thermophilus]|uniref:uncharacterized protein n=1 Tax=Humicola insolens TaxID=85995 RepID=UPI0037441F4D
MVIIPSSDPIAGDLPPTGVDVYDTAIPFVNGFTGPQCSSKQPKKGPDDSSGSASAISMNPTGEPVCWVQSAKDRGGGGDDIGCEVGDTHRVPMGSPSSCSL